MVYTLPASLSNTDLAWQLIHGARSRTYWLLSPIAASRPHVHWVADFSSIAQDGRWHPYARRASCRSTARSCSFGMVSFSYLSTSRRIMTSRSISSLPPTSLLDSMAALLISQARLEWNRGALLITSSACGLKARAEGAALAAPWPL